MEILVYLFLFLLFVVTPTFGILLIIGILLNSKNPGSFERIKLFLLFLLLPHKYLHQMYNYVSSRHTEGRAINVQYAYQGEMYEGNAVNYYAAIWNATEAPEKVI